MFIVKFTGQIECAQIYPASNLFCKFQITQGPDWQVIHGQVDGISQIAVPKSGMAVWNFPLDVSFKSTNAFGWPQLIVSIYGPDFMKRDIIRGYGCLHLPITAGKNVLYLDLFAPKPSSGLNSLLGTLVGRPPELLDSKFVSKSEGRQVMRVESDGTVKCVVNCTMKDFDKYYDL